MTLFPSRNSKRATLIGVALFFALGGRVSAAGKVETYQDIVEKAYTLSLQKDRTQAVNLLVSAARKETRKGQPPKEILTALEEVSTIFYSDKAQQLHELALSLRATDPNLAAQNLNEASRIEPENQQITTQQIRLQITTGDCDGALKQQKKWSERNPYSEEIKLLGAQALLCLGKLAEYQQVRAAVEKKNPLDLYWKTLDLEHAFKTGAFAKGRELAIQLQNSDSVYPEPQYWLWKFDHELKIGDEKPARKYLAACKSLSSRALRQYLAEPRLCRRTAEVEAELKKTGGSGG
jgi:hypothetical protein